VLQLSPDLRPTAQELISSSWLKGPCKKPVPVKNIVSAIGIVRVSLYYSKKILMVLPKKMYLIQENNGVIIRNY